MDEQHELLREGKGCWGSQTGLHMHLTHSKIWVATYLPLLRRDTIQRPARDSASADTPARRITGAAGLCASGEEQGRSEGA